MSNSNRTAGRNLLGAAVAAAFLFVAAMAGTGPAYAAGACALVPNARTPSEKTLQCGENLTVRAAQGTRYRTLYKKGDPLPVGIRLDDGALLIEFHPASPQDKFQILTPLAMPRFAGRNGRWRSRSANLHACARRGSGGDQPPPEPIRRPHGRGGRRYHSADTSMVQKRWGEAKVRRFFPVLASEWRPNGRDLPGF